MPLYNPTSSTSVVESWYGYHANDSTWSRSNTAYGDFTADVSSTFTQVINNSFGTVTSAVSGSDKLPGIVFTPSGLKTYEIIVSFVGFSGANNDASYRLVDGNGTVIAELHRQVVDNGAFVPLVLQGQWTAPATTSQTIKIQAKASTSTVNVGAPSAITGSAYYNIRVVK